MSSIFTNISIIFDTNSPLAVAVRLKPHRARSNAKFKLFWGNVVARIKVDD